MHMHGFMFNSEQLFLLMQNANDAKRLLMYVFDFPIHKVGFISKAFFQYSDLADIFWSGLAPSESSNIVTLVKSRKWAHAVIHVIVFSQQIGKHVSLLSIFK